MPRLVAPALDALGAEARGANALGVAIALDDSQRAVVDARSGPGAIVLGAPGTGKTSTLVEVVAAAIVHDGLTPDQVQVLTPSRRTATALRDRLAARLATEGAGLALPGPLARSIAAYAHAVATSEARLAGESEPRLLSGADQDADLAELLEGHLQDGAGPEWPAHLGADVRGLTAFRTELRDLIARLSEHDWSTDRLRAEAARRARPEWTAAADLVEEYRAVLAGYREDQVDPAELVRAAVEMVRDPRPGAAASPRLVLVDDAQDVTPSGFDLLEALAGTGATVILFGDPDVATNTFRGAEPDALPRLSSRAGFRDLPTLVLQRAHRSSEPLRQLTADLTARVGAAAAGAQRRAQARRDDDESLPGGAVLALAASSPARERALIADVLRERHILDGVPWSKMAVIVRSGALVPPIVRALAVADVPVRSTAAGRPLREHPAARALIRHVDVGVGRSALDAEAATELLLGPLGGLDRIGLRRLRRALRAEELAGEGSRTADELLVDAMSAPDRLVTLDHRVARRTARLARTLHHIHERHVEGATVDELLWIAWDEARVVESWRAAAQGHGATAAEADQALDAVTALFTAAATIVDTVPDATVDAFLARVLDSDVADDLLAPQRVSEAVLVASPAAAVGLEVDVVVVAGVTDGVWPNLRIRGSLLHAPEISRVAAGLPLDDLDERRLVLDDEIRMFALAVSRARRQVVVTSTSGEDDRPSALWDLVADHAGDSGEADALVRRATARSLRRLVGHLRRTLTDPSAGETLRAEAARALRRLADEEVLGADPKQWWGLLEPSSSTPLFTDESVRLSPSKLAAIENSALDWFLDRIAPEESTSAMGVGTIVHAAIETVGDPSVDAVWEIIEARWNELVFESPWLAEQQKRLAHRYAQGVAAYLRDTIAAGRVLVAAEQSFQVEVDGAVLRGVVDRLERAADGGVRIIDVKTGAPVSSAKAADNPQLGAYQLAYADGAFDEVLAELGPHHPAGARLLFVREGTKGADYSEAVQQVLDADGLDAFRERLRQAVSAIAVAQLTGIRTVDRFSGSSVRHRIHRVPPVTSER